jgi:chorismate mutase-like protein
MPALAMTDDLASFRRRIDAIDDRLLALLGERFAVIREVAAHKAPRGIPAVIPERVAEVRERCAGEAPRHGLDPDAVRRLYDLLIGEACRLEDKLIADWRDNADSSSGGEAQDDETP